MVNDTISDMLTRIRNANVASKTCVSIPKTKVHIKAREEQNRDVLVGDYAMQRMRRGRGENVYFYKRLSFCYTLTDKTRK